MERVTCCDLLASQDVVTTFSDNDERRKGEQRSRGKCSRREGKEEEEKREKEE